MVMTSREKAQLCSYQLREVAQVWYTQWKDNRTIESGSIEWEEFKKVFLETVFLGVFLELQYVVKVCSILGV